MNERHAVDGIFKVSAPEKSMEFTGERMTTAVEGEIEFEHFHRYCLARDLCQGIDVLDVASGEGYGSSILSNAARSVTGVDIDPQAIAHARSTYATENSRFIQGSALELPLGDASVDAVVSFETLEHVREHARFMAEVKRVLRPGGRLIVSTPERAVYSARGEPVNEFHALELTADEFDSLLRVYFKHVALLSQRAILGSIIVQPEGGGAWRSYERRSIEYIEASGGLARAPFLIAIASDEELRDIPSTVYLDRRRPGEVVGGYLQLPAYQSHVAALSAEVNRLNALASSNDNEIRRLNAAVSALNGELSSIKVERDAQIASLNDQFASLNDERTRLTGQANAYAAALNSLQGRIDKLTHSLRWRFINGVVHSPRTVIRALRWPFARAAFHKNDRPRGWLRGLGFHPADPQSKRRGLSEQILFPASVGAPVTNADSSNDEAPQDHIPVPENGVSKRIDEQKPTILVVAHEATRSGAPILALNLVQLLSARYNVVSLVLVDGELTDQFRNGSTALFVADRRSMTDKQLKAVIRRITSQYSLMFAIVNSVAAYRVLSPLKAEGIPTISLVHEFSSSMRPRSALYDVLNLSTETVFSTKITLENAISDFWLYPGASIHVAPQGKCIVPETRGATEALVEKTWLTSNLRPAGAESKFLAIGVGNVELRKGIDLFIECATILINQPGGERFSFVWIGDGFDPENEMAYSVYLDDQIKRAGLELQLKILRSTSQIELAYQLSDVLLIPSRLDPLPNVAIDALLAGRPVLCFEKTTGIADFLVENGLGDHCVARYLDTQDLAAKIKALADSPALQTHVVERSRMAAEKAFDMNDYVKRVEAIAMQAVGNQSRVENEVKAILTSGKFRSDFFRHAGLEAASEEEIIEDYLHRMACGLGVRKPMPGFHPTIYASLQAPGREASLDPFVDFLQKGLPEGPWLQRVIRVGEQETKAQTNARVALHVHAFYPDQLPSIVHRLNLNACTPDLFISVVTQEGATEAREAVSSYRGRLADLQITPNFGRDIGPFITQFGPALCSGYDIIGHCHTKKSLHVTDRPFAEAWNTFLLENLIGGERGGAAADTILSTMELNPGIGIVFPDDPHVISWTKNRKFAEKLADRMKFGELPMELNFPVGSMFWARSTILAKLVKLNLAWGDYHPEPVPIDGTVIHAIERLFGVVPAALGMTCAVTNVYGLTR